GTAVDARPARQEDAIQYVEGKSEEDDNAEPQQGRTRGDDAVQIQGEAHGEPEYDLAEDAQARGKRPLPTGRRGQDETGKERAHHPGDGPARCRERSEERRVGKEGRSGR